MTRLLRATLLGTCLALTGLAQAAGARPTARAVATPDLGRRHALGLLIGASLLAGGRKAAAEPAPRGSDDVRRLKRRVDRRQAVNDGRDRLLSSHSAAGQPDHLVSSKAARTKSLLLSEKAALRRAGK